MKILGIDPGETTGYAVIEAPADGDRKMKLLDYGTIPTPAQTWEGHLHEQKQFIWRKCEDIDDMEVAYEVGIQAAKCVTSPAANEMRGVLKCTLYELLMAGRIVAYHGYHPGTIKKCIRSGKLTKAEMRKWVAALFGTGALKSPDMADAIAVAACHAVTVHKARFPCDVVSLPSNARGGKQKQNALDSLTADEIREGIRTGKLQMRGRHVVATG